MGFEKPTLLEKIGEKLARLLIGNVYKNYLNNLELKGTENVIEMGSYSGNFSRYIAECLDKGGFLTCVDTSVYWTAKAKNRMAKYGNVEIKTGDIRDLDVESEYYDGVIIHFMLHDVNKLKRQDLINTLSLKLKKGGKIYIREPIKDSHGMPASEIKSIMDSAGLKPVSERHNRVMSTEMFEGIYEKQA